MLAPSGLQQSFQANYPKLRRFAAARFRHLKGEERDEAVANTLANVWAFFVSRSSRPDAHEGHLFSALLFAVRQTKCRRGVQGQARKNDCYQRCRKIVGDDGEDVLASFAGKRTSVPDQVAFRLDVPSFIESLSPRHQLIVRLLIEGVEGKEIAQRLGVSPSAVSQARERIKERFDFHFAV